MPILGDRDVIDTLLANERRETLDLFFDLWDDNVVLEIPYARPPRPNRLVGKATIEPVIRPVIMGWRSARFVDINVRATAEPGEFVAEYRGDIVLESNGRPHNNVYISIMRVKNGKLVFWREYSDPFRTLASYGPG